jgi:hypothetical protein
MREGRMQAASSTARYHDAEVLRLPEGQGILVDLDETSNVALKKTRRVIRPRRLGLAAYALH